MPITIPLTILDLYGDGFHLLVNIYLFDHEYKLVVDTGASKTAFDKTLLSNAVHADMILESDRLSTGLGTNNMTSFTATIEGMQVSDFEIDAFEAAVLDLSTINIAYEQLGYEHVLGVLGGDILMKYKAKIDYGKKTLTLKYAKRKKSLTK